MTAEGETGGPARETSRAEVVLYAHGDDPLIASPLTGKITTRGDARNRGELALVAAGMQKRLGGGAGSFYASIKGAGYDLLDVLMDDDWVDLSFTTGRRRHHVMRGLISTIEVEEGPASVTYNITGREWSSVYELTEIFFNRFTLENVTGEAALRAHTAVTTGFGTVAESVAVYLTGYLREMNGAGRALWDLPPGLPGVPNRARFIDAVRAPFSDDWSNDPPRKAFNPNWLLPPESNPWALATEWSDPEFTELYPELLLRQASGSLDHAQPLDETTPDNTAMAVVLRDRPFPTFEAPGGLRNSLWFALPEHVISRGHLIGNQTWVKSGGERHNAFFVSPVLTQELAGSPFDFSAPLWDPNDVRRHGIRRYDMRSRYLCQTPDLNLTLSTKSRNRLRDWHCLNPHFRSARLVVKPGRPEIRLGTRIKIPGARGPNEDRRAYVEGVQHDWLGLEQGTQSRLMVTRGWKGTEDSMIDALSRTSKRYSPASAAITGIREVPDEVATGEEVA